MSIWNEYLEIQEQHPGWELQADTQDTLIKEDDTGASLTIVKKGLALYDWKRTRPFVGISSGMWAEAKSLKEAMQYVESPNANII